MDKGDLRKTVDHLWSFLDNLAESDPSAYKDFVSKQLKEGPGKVPEREQQPKQDQPNNGTKQNPSIILPFKSALTDNNSVLPEEDIDNVDGIRLSAEQQKNDKPLRKILIEEVKETPNYSLTRTNSGIVLEIHLPLLDDIKAVAVDISSQEFLLDCPEYFLQVSFPKSIDNRRYRAKWLKKRRKLIISE